MTFDFITTKDFETFKSEMIQSMNSINIDIKPKKWLRSKEVRIMLGISPGTLQQMRINGTIPYTRIGSMLFYSLDDIHNILEKNKSCDRS